MLKRANSDQPDFAYESAIADFGFLRDTSVRFVSPGAVLGSGWE
jgi:hypothetical protein